MIELTRRQTMQLGAIGIKWTPDTAESIVSVVSALGLPVYPGTLSTPATSAGAYECLGLSFGEFCGNGTYGRRVITIDEFIMYLFTEVLV